MAVRPAPFSFLAIKEILLWAQITFFYLSRMEDAPARNRFNWNRLETVLLVLGVALALWPVWANGFFLTNDGPCHLYNARILRDMLLGQDTAFYAEWYMLNPEIEPNWLNHFLLTLFQLVLPPVVSEKLFLTLYIVGYALCFRYLARSIFPANGALTTLCLPFIFHTVFHWGFFNYAASVVLFFLLVGHWLRHRAHSKWKSRLMLGVLMLLLLLAHPVSYCLGMGLIACQWGGETLAALIKRQKDAMQVQVRTLLTTTLAALPSLVLFAMFMVNQGTDTVPGNTKFHTLFHDFLELKCLVLFEDAEKALPIILSILIGLLGVAALVRLAKRPPVYEGILVMLALSLYAYFNQPAVVGGVGVVPARLQFYPYLIVLCWLVTIPWPRWLLRVACIAGFVLTATLFSMRLPSFALYSDAAEEFVTAKDHMKPYTTVVMLNYAPEGRLPNDDRPMGKHAYIFMHIAEYLGALQPHIMLNNYEATTQWFPLQWKPNRDPYRYLAEFQGFEGWLPRANFETFRKETGKEVDYVIMWGLEEGLRDNPDVMLMRNRLDSGYVETYVSDGNRVRLYERKGL
jgi:hypothetical protein